MRRCASRPLTVLGGSGPLRLTPLELLERLAALIPPPRVHRHRYYGVLAPIAPLRAAVTALAPPPAASARVPALWELPGAGASRCDPHSQPAPEYEFDQRIAW